MMTPIASRDSAARPELFQWFGPIDAMELEQWLSAHALNGKCPADLVALWTTTGGGELFETETLLGPFAPDPGDRIWEVNQALRAGGVPPRFLVFHVGMAVSAVDVMSGDYVQLRGAEVVERFPTLQDWYARLLRAEYASRYGLG